MYERVHLKGLTMNIRNNNDTSFNGLWGFKTYNKQPVREGFSTHGYRNSLPTGLELFQIDRFYPFADDSKEVIEKEMNEALKKGFVSRGTEKVPFSKSGVILEEVLPFTRAEYMAYKSKNMQSKIIELTAVEKNIENFLVPLMKGLSSYKNQYKEATFVDKFKFALRKCIK